MIELLSRMQQHFDTMHDRFICFHDLGFQTEGWFKGELVTLFSQLQREGIIQELDREVLVGTKKVDVKIRLNGLNHWIELKHWLIGKQKGVNCNVNFYFSDGGRDTGITKDVDKLNGLTGHRWMLMLLTRNPGVSEWEAGVEKFNDKFNPRRIESRTHPDTFPNTYFLGLLDLGLRLEQ